MPKYLTFFDKLFSKKKTQTVGGYATHSPKDLLTWIGLGLLAISIIGILLVTLILSIGFQIAKVAFPDQNRGSISEVSRSWLEQQFSTTQNKVSALEKQVSDLTQEIDALQATQGTTSTPLQR